MIDARTLLQIAIAGSVLLLGAAVVMLRQSARDRRLQIRLDQVRTGQIGGVVRSSSARSALRMVAGIGQGVLRSGVVSSQTATAQQRSLEGAGIRSPNAVAVFIAAKIIMLVLLPALGLMALHGLISSVAIRNMVLVALAVVGLLAPDYVVRSLRKRYQKGIAEGLPDALDMLVMCAESGLSLEPAIQRVGTEIVAAHPGVGAELLLTAGEFQISTDAAGVLLNLGERTGLPDLKRVVATLSQTLQYGTPLAESLRVLSAEMRTEILTRFEERAARLPVLLTLPMITFILPSLFLIVGGPAILQAIRLFKS